MTAHNTHNRKTSMLTVGFEPTISAGEQPQTYALERAASGTGTNAVWRPEMGLRHVTSHISATGIPLGAGLPSLGHAAFAVLTK